MPLFVVPTTTRSTWTPRRDDVAGDYHGLVAQLENRRRWELGIHLAAPRLAGNLAPPSTTASDSQVTPPVHVYHASKPAVALDEPVERQAGCFLLAGPTDTDTDALRNTVFVTGGRRKTVNVRQTDTSTYQTDEKS